MEQRHVTPLFPFVDIEGIAHMCSACTLKGEKGFLSGQRRRGNVVDPTRNNHRKWKHDVGHDIEAVSVLLSHDSTTASSAALLRRPSIPPIPGNLPPIPAATSPTTSFSTRCSPVIPRNYNHSWTDFSLISIYIYMYIRLTGFTRIVWTMDDW